MRPGPLSGALLTAPLVLLALGAVAAPFVAPPWWTGTGAGTATIPAESLLIAAAAALLSIPLGTAAGLGFLARFSGRWLAVLLIGLPLLLMPALSGTALPLSAERAGHGAGGAGMLLGQVLLGAPLVAASVWTALSRVGPALFRAAAACGATPWRAARALFGARLWPAVAWGAAIAVPLLLARGILAAMPDPGPAAVATGLTLSLLPALLTVALLGTWPARRSDAPG